MIVVDASAALSALLNDGPARAALGTEQTHAPHLVDAEVVSVLRRKVRTETLSAPQGWTLVDAWRRLGVVRYPMTGLLERVWMLRENLSSYDACYVALAEHLGCGLLTADARLGRAPGLRCSITLVPR